MTRWIAERAWLGGDSFVSNVVIETDGGSIVEISTGQGHEDAISLRGIVLPGLVSAHSHAFHRILRGRTHGEGGDFWAWRTPMYEAANALTPESYRSLAGSVFTEMLGAGITTVGEFHYVHHRPDGTPYDDPNAFARALCDAATATGIRLTLVDAAYLASGVDGTAPLPEQARFSDSAIASWADRVRDLATFASPTVRIAVAAHSIRGVPREDLAAIAATAADLELPIHVHASEQPAEVEDSMRVHGATPIAVLEAEAMLGQTTTVVHATHATPADIDILAATGTGVCLCPTTEADLGDGIGPAIELSRAGVALSLGSDSNAVIDILREAQSVELFDRLRLGARGLHSPASLLSAATTNGMAALGWPSGGLTAGVPADFIALDTSHPDLVNVEPTPAAVVMAATRAAVSDVIVAGRQVVARGPG